MKRALLALAMALGLPGTGHAETFTLPPFTQAYEPQGVDERGAWMMADEQERLLRSSKFVIRDDGLNHYVRGVFCRTVGQDRCANVRIYVMRMPEFNATMYPNGMMTVWSGLLLRVQSEAELGAVLGHEFGHFEKRHGVFGFKNKRTMSDVMAWIGVAAPQSAGFQYSLLGQVYAFNREQEREADMIGVQYLAASDYPSSAAARVWRRLMAEQDASASARGRKAKHGYAAGYFASHPSELSRATTLEAAAVRYGDEGDEGRAAYAQALKDWLPEFLGDQIKRNDFGGSDFILSQLASDGWSGPLLFARAELYSQRGNPRDYVTAAQFYEQAIEKGYAAPKALRGLGLAQLRTQQTEQGKASLRQYLQQSPDASDASLISSLIGN